MAALLIFLINNAKQLISFSKNVIEMGTAVSMTVYGEKGLSSESVSREKLSQITSQILGSIDDLDRKTLSWRSEDSEIRRFNHLGQGEEMPVSSDLARVIRESLILSQESDHAMDITLRPVIDVWGIESYDGAAAYIPPSDDELEKLVSITGSDHMILRTDESGSAFLKKDIPELSLDLGAVGKGYALDLAADKLADSKINGAVLAAGGRILVWGDKGEPWRVGVRDPEGAPNDYLGILSIPGDKEKSVFVSTSGGYEKYVEYEGQILEHIIDGRTLHPAESDLYSVTVLTTDSGLASDGLSTACYLLGIGASLPLLENHQAEAVFVSRDKKIYLTNGLKGVFSPIDMGYSLSEIP